ncbi:sodium/glutamate symporter [Marinobacter hydrocarbonoclasticus]|nr:sodium/glutamate symporter [Marinobacter nauticus]
MVLSLKETVLAAILVLLIGRGLTHLFAVLRRYNIPEPVSGGIFASVLALVAHEFWGLELQFDMALRDALLLAFFTTIGLTARLDALTRGGRPLAVLMLFCVGGVILQNLVGLGMAGATGLAPSEGLLLGSVSLFGGHGTSVAWASVFEQRFGIDNALEIGIGSATLGLIMGGIVGGPMAQRLIERYSLKSAEPVLDAHPRGETPRRRISSQEMFVVLMYVSAGMILGGAVSNWAETQGVNIPEFLACMLVGMVMTNTLPRVLPKLEAPSQGQALPLLSEVSLGLFLAMSLMGMQLWTLVDLALPMLLTVVAQVLAMLLMVRFALFPLLGKNYNSAVLCAGYMGMGLGALPNAMANMNALVGRYGAAPLAFMILPLANAFFVDLANALVLQLTINNLQP